MDLGLGDRLVLVTGSSEGIGLEIAKQFVVHGARVVVNGRSRDKLDAAVASLCAVEARRHEPVAAVADVSTAAGCAELAAQVDALGELDVLVNSAGIFHVQAFESGSDEFWQRHWETNVMSGVRLSRHYLPRMKAACPAGGDRFARIVHIASETGMRPIADKFLHYSVSKTSNISFSRGVAELTRGTNVTSNSVLAGPTMTEGVRAFLADLAAKNGVTNEEMERRYFQAEEPTSIIGRFIQPKEIADAVLFLSSRLASAINGSAMRVEGGIIRHI